MDQCRQCSLRGDRAGCEQADCSWHELWYVGELREEIKRLKDQVKRQNSLVELLRRCCVYLRRANGLNPTESSGMIADIRAALEGEGNGQME